MTEYIKKSDVLELLKLPKELIVEYVYELKGIWLDEAEQTEPSQTHEIHTETHGVRSKKELCAKCEYHDWKIDEHIGYISVCNGIGRCPYNIVETITSEPHTDCSWR